MTGRQNGGKSTPYRACWKRQTPSAAALILPPFSPAAHMSADCRSPLRPSRPRTRPAGGIGKIHLPYSGSVVHCSGPTPDRLPTGHGDLALRFLGRLRDGFTADTLNIILLGDNRPGFA
jgi:hypothetical protein